MDTAPTASTLSADDVSAFIERGFVRVEGAFPRDVADAGRAFLWDGLRTLVPDIRPDDPRTWSRPVLRLHAPDRPPFRVAGNTARLYSAFDALVGKGRWRQHAKLGGSVAVRFPHAQLPDDAGWHIDGSYEVGGKYWVNVRSRGRALLALFLFSDVGRDDAPTRIRVGSHLLVPKALEAAGDEGMLFDQVPRRLPTLDTLPIELATGKAGDVYLCHPFLVHAADAHRGTAPRFLGQPELQLLEPLVLDRSDGDDFPVERAVKLGLDR